MLTHIKAVYEGGVFRPTRQVSLAEGTHVEVLIPQDTAPRDSKAVAARLSEIARRAPRTEGTESTSRDHDRILYNRESHP